jgi:hypothetical protein
MNERSDPDGRWKTTQELTKAGREKSRNGEEQERNEIPLFPAFLI